MSTPVEKELMARLKEAMKARDKVAIGAIRMARSKITEARTAKGAKELDDAGVRGVVASYVKSLRGAVEDFRGQGVPDEDDAIASLLAEMAILEPWMPQLLGEAETAAIVDAVVADNGLDSPKMLGRGIGLVMKSHKGKVDPALVRQLLQARLAG